MRQSIKWEDLRRSVMMKKGNKIDEDDLFLQAMKQGFV